MSEAAVKTGGRTFTGWKEFSFGHKLESLASTLELKTATDIVEGFRITAGSAVQFLIDGIQFLDGHIDTKDFDDSATEVNTTFNSRSKFGDVVDCSVIYATGELKNQTLKQLITKALDPFAIELVDEIGDHTKFKLFRIEPGETAYEMIDRACRMRGCMAIERDGKLVLTRIKAATATKRLEYGVNIKQFECAIDFASRFSEYKIISQVPAGLNLSPSRSSQPSARAKDPGVGRYRPLVILAESAQDIKMLQDRAYWEARTREQRANKITVTTTGFKQNGDFWLLGETIRVIHNSRGINGNFIVSGLTFSKTKSDGELSVLELALPDAYDILPLPDTTKAEGLFG